MNFGRKILPRIDKRDLYLSKYTLPALLPTVPESFKHGKITEWDMLGNDKVGNCVIAGGYHLEKLWTSYTSSLPLDTETALKTYSEITGYVPGNPATDQGTYIRDFLKYWRKNGIPDSEGKIHKIGAFVRLRQGNLKELAYASYFFNGTLIGILFPDYAMDLFEAGKKWDYVHPFIFPNNGHCVSVIGKNNEGFTCITWGQEQLFTESFGLSYIEEAWAILSEEYILNGKTLQGVDLQTLIRDLSLL